MVNALNLEIFKRNFCVRIWYFKHITSFMMSPTLVSLTWSEFSAMELSFWSLSMESQISQEVRSDFCCNSEILFLSSSKSQYLPFSLQGPMVVSATVARWLQPLFSFGPSWIIWERSSSIILSSEYPSRGKSRPWSRF